LTPKDFQLIFIIIDNSFVKSQIYDFLRIHHRCRYKVEWKTIEVI